MFFFHYTNYQSTIVQKVILIHRGRNLRKTQPPRLIVVTLLLLVKATELRSINWKLITNPRVNEISEVCHIRRKKTEILCYENHQPITSVRSLWKKTVGEIFHVRRDLVRVACAATAATLASRPLGDEITATPRSKLTSCHDDDDDVIKMNLSPQRSTEVHTRVSYATHI